MGIRGIIEMAAIIGVSCLMVLFAGLYFTLTKKQQALAAANNDNLSNAADVAGLSAEWAEQLQIMHAQLDLVCELGPAFAACYDYSRRCFSISENGRAQLGLPENAGQESFEGLIHPDDVFVWEETVMAVTDNIRKAELAGSPYIIRLRRESGEYGEYLARIKPVYDVAGLTAALVVAFICTDYLRRGRE